MRVRELKGIFKEDADSVPTVIDDLHSDIEDLKDVRETLESHIEELERLADD